ncbi:hypothetical protein LTR86_003844 [Recurvomyces mirabilis]|nr:hypothetical protein LTR86_003844 [Recurvomyces mirabilis]
MDLAIEIALSISMQSRSFASTHGLDDAALQESWRRTWWQICILDAYYAAMMQTTSALMCESEIDITTDLPCEEIDYETGIIPVPKTIEEFHSRDVTVGNHTFSSFAYLVGALQAVSCVKESSSVEHTSGSRIHPSESLSIATEAWLLLLPDSKKAVHFKNGEIDELMFQAHMTIQA